MTIELVRITKENDFKYYLKIDGNYVIDPRFIYSHLKSGEERLNHIKEVISKFGELDYELGSIDGEFEETLLISEEINKNDNLFINSKVTGRFLAKK